MNVCFVRHGQTDWNVAHKIMGSVDIGLNAEGERQAAEARDQLADKHFDVILTSPLGRAKKTAEYIAERHPNTPLIVVDELRERNFGAYEGKHNNGDYYGLWQYNNAETPGGETPKDLEKRVHSLLDQIHETYAGDVLIVGHGGVGLLIKTYYHGVPASGDLLEYVVGNGIVQQFKKTPRDS